MAGVVPPSPARGAFSALSLEEQKARRMARLQSMSTYAPTPGRFAAYTETVQPPTPFHPSTNQNSMHPDNPDDGFSPSHPAVGITPSPEGGPISLRTPSARSQAISNANRRALSAWSCSDPKGAFATAGIILVGALKGLLLCPLIIPAHIIGCLLINCFYVLAAFDYGFAAIRFTRFLGPNLKALAFVTFPFFYMLFFVISPVLALFFSLGFSFAYPAYVTLDAFRQSGMRHSVTRSAWSHTLEQSWTNIVGYAYTYSLLLPEWAHKVITAKSKRLPVPQPEGGVAVKEAPIDPFEIHPLDWFVGFLIFVLVFPLFGALLAVIAAIKLLPIIARAYINHFSAAGNWFKSTKSAVAWVLYLPFIPVVAVFLIPGSFIYSLYIGWKSGGAVIAAHGNPLACWPILKTSFTEVDRSSTRFIKGLDVPFVVLPQKKLAIQWVLAATLPFLIGIIVLPLPLILLALLFVIPVLIRSYAMIELHLTNGGRNSTQASRSIPLCLLILLLPIVVPVALLFYALATVFKMAGAFGACSDAKGIGVGFDHIPGVLYYFEYKLNEYCFKRRSDETLHAFSMMPGFKEPCKRANLLPASEFEAPYVYSGSVVTPQARYVPPGTRKPKFDANGRMVDMSGAAIHIPGVGVAPIINGNIVADSVIPILPPGQTRLPANVSVPEALLAAPTPSPIIAPASAAAALAAQQQQQAASAATGIAGESRPAINTSSAPSPANAAGAGAPVSGATTTTPNSAASRASGFSIFAAATGKGKDNAAAIADPNDHAEIAIRTRRAAGCLCCAANAAAGEDPFHTEADERARAAALHEAKLEAALKAAAQIETEAKAAAEAAKKAAEEAAATAAAEEAARAKAAAEEAARRQEEERRRKELEDREMILRQAMSIVNDARIDDLATAQRIAAANGLSPNSPAVASIPLVASPTAQRVLESQSIKAASFIGTTPLDMALGLSPSPKNARAASPVPQTPGSPRVEESAAVQTSPELVTVEVGSLLSAPNADPRKAAAEALESLEGLAASIQQNMGSAGSSAADGDSSSSSSSSSTGTNAHPLMTDTHARALQAMSAARSLMQAAQTAAVASRTARVAREHESSASPERQAARALVEAVEAPSSGPRAGGGRRNSAIGIANDSLPHPTQGRRNSLVGSSVERGRRRSSVAESAVAAAAAVASGIVIPLVPSGPDGSPAAASNVLPSSASAVRRASAALGAFAAATALTEQYQGALNAASNSVAIATALVDEANVRSSAENDGISGGSASTATSAAVAGRTRRPSHTRASMSAVSLDTAPSSNAAAHSRQPSHQRQSIVNIMPTAPGSGGKKVAAATSAAVADGDDEDDGSVIVSVSEVPRKAAAKGKGNTAGDDDSSDDDGLQIISS